MTDFDAILHLTAHYLAKSNLKGKRNAINNSR